MMMEEWIRVMTWPKCSPDLVVGVFLDMIFEAKVKGRGHREIRQAQYAIVKELLNALDEKPRAKPSSPINDVVAPRDEAKDGGAGGSDPDGSNLPRRRGRPKGTGRKAD